MDTENKISNNVEKYRVDGMSLKNKTDKIVAAIHMVTDCIEDNEPIRYKLRSLSVELASEVHEMVHTPARDRGFLFVEIEIIATEIMSFLSIARSVRLVSEMNADILLRELSANTERMRTWTETGLYDASDQSFTQATKPVDFTLNESHFAIPNPAPLMPPAQQVSSVQYNSTNHTPAQQPATSHKGQVPKTMPVSIQQKQQVEDNKKFDFAMKLNRRNAILKIIKDKKEVTIKDISTLIADCSEKTIQRELTNLVQEGVLKKVGEKRWSKYMLA